jgi:hypothetical protein
MARSVRMTQLSPEDIHRFEANAPAAVARRGGNFFRREIALGFEQMGCGIWPLVGLAWLDWSTIEMASFFFVRMWIGIFCDLFKLCTLQEAVMRWAKVKYDDWHVWVVAQALRDNQKELVESHLRAHYQPWLGVLVDFLFGGVGTVATIGMLIQGGSDDIRVQWDGSFFFISLVLCVVFPFVMTTWEVARHRVVGDSAGEVTIASGGRGIALFLLTFVAVIAQSNDVKANNLAMWLMVAVNGAVIFAGALNVLGYWLVKGETRWLEQYLQKRQTVESP